MEAKKTQKKKLHRGVIAGTVLAVVVLPVSVYASFLPLDLDLGSLGEGVQRRDSSESRSLSAQDVLPKVPMIYSTSRDIFRSISTGNLDGALRGVLGILGELGLLNPAAEAARVGSGSAPGSGSGSGSDPYANPQTPQQVYERERHRNLTGAAMPQQLSQVVFGPQGQQALTRQLEAIQVAQQASLEGQQGVAQAAEESAKQAEQTATAAESVKTKAAEAKSAKASQDVLKAIAAQNEDLAKIGAGHSAQLSQLGKAAAFQSAQISAANAQLGALNDKAQVLEVLSASQNYLASQIDAAIDHQNHYQQTKDGLATNVAHQSSTMVYIPGLMPQEGGR